MVVQGFFVENAEGLASQLFLIEDGEVSLVHLGELSDGFVTSGSDVEIFAIGPEGLPIVISTKSHEGGGDAFSGGDWVTALALGAAAISVAVIASNSSSAAELALAKIKAFDGSNAEPTVADYDAAGVVGVTDQNLTVVNDLVSALAADQTTIASLDTLIDTLSVSDGGTATFTVDGSELTVGYDDDGDGVVDRNEVYTLDASGQVTGAAYDDDADGVVDRTKSVTTTTDADGNTVVTTAFDANADGVVDRTKSVTTTTDADGNTVVTTAIDVNADGVVNQIKTDTLNDRGQTISTSVDKDADGAADRIDTYTLNDRGQRTSTSVDADADGTVDQIHTYTLNDLGQHTSTSYDKDADGTVDRIDTYTLNDLGQRTSTSVDADADGAADRLSFSNALDATFDVSSDYASNAIGLETVNLATTGASTLVISDASLAILAGGNAAYQLIINGDANDTVDIDAGITATGNTVAVGAENYIEYSGTSGTFIVDPDVNVI